MADKVRKKKRKQRETRVSFLSFSLVRKIEQNVFIFSVMLVT